MHTHIHTCTRKLSLKIDAQHDKLEVLAFFFFAAAFTDGRLIIIITKFDQNYSHDQVDSHEAPITEENAQECVLRSIYKILKINKADVEIENPVVFSSRWSKLAIAWKTNMQDSTWRDDTIKALAVYSCIDNHLPRGESESKENALKRCTSPQLAKFIEDASGMSCLRER